MKNFKNAQSTKAKLPENERIIGGDVDKKFNNDKRIKIITTTLKKKK